MTLDCLQLMYANAGSEGIGCTTGSVIRFSEFIDVEAGEDLQFGPDGYFLLATEEGPDVDLVTTKADLQNGPVDGLYLINVDIGLSAEGILDSVAYGGPMDACEIPVMEGSSYAPNHSKHASIGRAVDHVDTDENGADWVVCPEPTPGAMNACPEPVVCGDVSGPLTINELKVGSTSDASVPFEDVEYVEISGPPLTPLDCYVLRTRNGGQEGDQCKIEENTPLVGLSLDDTGLIYVEMDLQKTGPDAVELIFLPTNYEEVSVDSVVWGGSLFACPDNVGSGSAASVPSNQQSLARCWDQSNDATDFIFADPTPGLLNVCPDGPAPSTCEILPESIPIINEIQSGTSASAFVELIGTPGLRLDCLSLVAHNGKEGNACDEYARIDLSGQEIGESGYFVVATTGGGGINLVSGNADLQDGPDALSLVFTFQNGSVSRLDSVAYGGSLPACEETVGEVGEGDPAKQLKAGKSITRCAGADTDDNADDFMLCNTPSPGAVTSCSCKTTGPGDVVVVQDPEGCFQSRASDSGRWLLLLMLLSGVVFAAARTRRRST